MVNQGPPSRGRHTRRQSAAVYRRRRLVAGGLFVTILIIGVLVVAQLNGGGSRSTSATSTTSSASTTTAPKLNDVTIAAVGDTELGNQGALPSDPASILAPTKSALAAPIVFGNLEGTMTNGSSSKCAAGSTQCYAFAVPPSYAQVMRDDGFTVLNSANNHSHDFGDQGVSDTTAALATAGIVQAGLPSQIGVTKEGGTKVAFVDFAPYSSTNNLLDPAAAKALITHAKSLADVVVVYMHTGAEGTAADHVTGQEETYLGEDRGNPEAFAHAAIDDGADLVLASGPHVLRGMQWYNGHLIAYSLGDYANYNNFASVGDLTLSAILKVTMTATGAFRHGTFTSLVLSSTGTPSVDSSGQSATLVNQLSSADFGPSAATIQADGTIAPPSTT